MFNTEETTLCVYVYVCVFVERVWIRFTDIFLKMFPKFIFNWRIIALIGG